MDLLARAETFGVSFKSRYRLDEETPKVFADRRGFPEHVA